MKVLTKELSGLALNWAVAKAKGWKDYPEDCVEAGRFWHTQPERAPFDPVIPKETWQPAYKWEHGGPIIEREVVQLEPHFTPEKGSYWAAWIKQQRNDGSTPLIAAMRCFVASKLAEEIDVPEELL